MLQAEIDRDRSDQGEQRVMLLNEADERIYRVGYVDALRRAVAVIEEQTQPLDYR